MLLALRQVFDRTARARGEHPLPPEYHHQLPPRRAPKALPTHNFDGLKTYPRMAKRLLAEVQLAGVGMSCLRGIAYIGLGLLIAYAWSGGLDRTERLPTSENVAPANSNKSGDSSPETAPVSDGKPIAIAPNFPAAPAEKLEIFGTERYVTASSLRLRAGPSMSAKKHGSLAKGTRVLIIERAGEWLKVSIQGGRQGWAFGEYLSAIAPPLPASLRSTTLPVAPRGQEPIATSRGGPGRDAIAQELIERSIARYQGNCACPYNHDRAGRSCGRRSAYSRAGGETPLCYRSDVTEAMIDAYR